MAIVLALTGCATAGDAESEPVPSTETGASSEAAPSEQATAETDLPDPCMLLSAADVSAALGWEVSAGTPGPTDPDGGSASCSWTRVGSIEFVQVYVSTDGSGSLEPYAAQYEGSIDESKDGTIPGADDSFVTTDGKAAGVIVGDVFGGVSIITAGEVSDGAAITDLAAVVARGL